MTGAQRLPWRFACSEGHQGLRRRADGSAWCQSCDEVSEWVHDLARDEQVRVNEARKRAVREGAT